jgi:hypothetical protein
MKEENFKIPTNFFDKFYDFTGSDESSRGFIMCYVNSNGDPVIYSRTPNAIVEMGLRKSLENYLYEEGQEEDSDNKD